MGHKPGFTLVEMIFTFMVSSIVMILLLSGISTLKHLKINSANNSDIDLFCYQLQQELYTAGQIEIKDNQLYYQREGKTFVIGMDKDRIVKKEGYEILLFNVDEMYFEMNDLLSIRIFREGNAYWRILKIMRENYG